MTKSTDFSNLTCNIKEAAEFLGFKSTARLSQKAQQGEIPACKPGREWVFLKEDLVQYLRSNYTGKINDQLFTN